MNHVRHAKFTLRNLQRSDFEQVYSLHMRTYGKDFHHSKEMLSGQLTQFPEGQFVVLDGERVIAHCATFIIDEATAFRDHTYDDITGGGFASRHDPDGDYSHFNIA